MKSPTQTLILFVVLVGMVGGVAFVRNWISTPGEDKPPDGNGPKEYILVFPNGKVAVGLGEHEVTQPGHYDFWFQNPNPHAVEAGVESKYCQCSQVEVLVLTKDAAAALQKEGGVAGAAVALGAVPNAPLNTLGGLAVVAGEIKKREEAPSWQLLTSEHGRTAPVTIPAEAAGFIRLGWAKRTRTGPELFWAKVWMQAPGDPRTRTGEGEKLDVPVMLVNPVQLTPGFIQVGDLYPGSRRDFEFLCWSATRPRFQLQSVEEESHNPCFVTTITPLSAEEFQKELKALDPSRQSQMRCGYRVRGTVYERLPNNGPQLELGPFERKLLLTTDQEDVRPLPESPPLSVTLRGVVRGEITVGTEESRDKIILKSFPANKGTSMTVPLESTETGLKLKIDSYKPDYLIVHLEDRGNQGGIRRWDLRVTVPPQPVSGMLPPESAIILKTQSQPPRSIRIPVLGRASVAVGGS